MLYVFFLREVTSHADILQLNESRHTPRKRGGNPSGWELTGKRLAVGRELKKRGGCNCRTMYES